MKFVTIIGVFVSVGLVAAIPLELQERQCLANGSKYISVLTDFYLLTNIVPCDIFKSNPGCCSGFCHSKHSSTLRQNIILIFSKILLAQAMTSFANR